jgi:WD40 repeat protein
MRAKPLLVAWHNKEPVFSVDFHDSGIFATGGADSTVKVRVVALNKLNC